MAKGAAESGAVESYMCSKVARNPVVQSSCAAYLGEFEADESANGIQRGTQWLVRFPQGSPVGFAFLAAVSVLCQLLHMLGMILMWPSRMLLDFLPRAQ